LSHNFRNNSYFVLRIANVFSVSRTLNYNTSLCSWYSSFCSFTWNCDHCVHGISRCLYS